MTHSAEIHAALVDGTWTVRSLVTALASRRKSLGLQQADVARIVGCGQQLVSRWEVGDNEPDLGQLQAYARAVGLELRLDLCVIPCLVAAHYETGEEVVIFDPGVVERITKAMESRVTPPESCPTPGCPGDIRYAAPGRNHIEGCTYPIPPGSTKETP